MLTQLNTAQTYNYFSQMQNEISVYVTWYTWIFDLYEAYDTVEQVLYTKKNVLYLVLGHNNMCGLQTVYHNLKICTYFQGVMNK